MSEQEHTPRAEARERGWERPGSLAGFDLARHAIVDASAGTGKTFTLEHLVLELVASGVPIEAILVVTFTDKAAREMKERVRARLVAAKEALERLEAAPASGGRGAKSATAAHLAAAIAGFDRAAISTIHAFCQRALAEHAFASGRSLALERVDRRTSFGRAFRAVVREAWATPPPPFGLAVRAAIEALGARSGTPVQALEELLLAWLDEEHVRPRFDPSAAAHALLATPSVEALSQRESVDRIRAAPSLSEGLPPEPPSRRVNRREPPSRRASAPHSADHVDRGALSESARWMSALESVAPWARRSRLRGALVELAIALEPHRDALAAELDAGEDATRGLAVSPAFGAALRWASTPADALRSNAAFCREALASAEEPPTEAGAPSPRAIFETLHEQLATPIPFLVHAVLPAVREAFRREKERAGVLDFDDLLTALRDAIAGEPAIRRALRARYRHALVDEFQDTDEVQWEIFRRLFLDRDEGDVSHASPSTLIVIGDAKQAIYGFRSADVHTYEDACRALEAAGAQRIVLDASFRSSPAMLAAQDRILRADAQDSTLARGFAGYERRLVAGRAARSALDARGDAAPAVVVQHLLGLVPLRAGLVRRALADAIARECRALVEGGALRLVDAREGGEAQRSLRYSDVFVLTRTGREGLEVADALGRAHVPHAFFKQSGLFASREAREVLDVLRAIAAPEDRSARTRALIGPFLGVPFGELAAAHALDANHPLARRLARWAELAAEGRLAALFAALVEGSGPLASGLTRRALYLHEGERVLVNHRHVLDLLLARSSERRLSLGELVVELEARIARSASGEEDDEDVQKLESEREAVQILTMHKSKGLEAEVVFLFGGFGAAPRRALEPRVAHERPTDPRLPSTRIAYALDPTLLATSRVRAGDDGELVPLADALEREAQLELERLYYVAMTRAKRRLYLPYVGPPPAGAPRRDDVRYAWERPSGSYRVLDERLAALARSGALAPPFFALEPIEVGPPTPTRGRTTQLAPQPRATLASIRVEDPRERALRVHALSGIEETSYTRMSAWAKARRAPSLEAPKIELAPAQAALAGELADEAGAASGPSGARFGVLVHGVLEELLVERLVPRDAASVLEAPRVRRRMEEHGASDEERALASLLAYRALVTPLEAESLSLPSGVGALARRAVEMPFLFPVPERAHPPFARSMRDLAIERGLVRGVIDLFFEHEGRAWVLDWKTDRLPSYDAASLGEHVERAYELQLALYTLAALRALARASGPSELAAVHARLGGVLYVFVRGFGADPSAPGLGVFATRPSLADVTAWERALREQDALLGGPLPERRHPLGLLVDADEEAG